MVFSMSSSLKIYVYILISPKQFYGIFRAIIKTHSRMSRRTHSQFSHLKFNLLNLFSSYSEFSRRLSPLNSGRILSYSLVTAVQSAASEIFMANGPLVSLFWGRHFQLLMIPLSTILWALTISHSLSLSYSKGTVYAS